MEAKFINEINKLSPRKRKELFNSFYSHMKPTLIQSEIIKLLEGDIATGQKTEEEILQKINEIKNKKIMAKESFKQKLAKTGKGALDERASQLAQMTKIEAVNTLNQQKAAVLRIEGQIASHQDLAVKNTQSLTVGDKDFDAKKWVAQEFELKKALRQAKIEYKIIKEWYDELFPEADDIEIDDVNIDE